MEWIMQPWPWYVAGPAIALTLFAVLYLGESFGVSAVSRTICAACGGGLRTRFFDYAWRRDLWNVLFVLGIVLGGAAAGYWLTAGPYVVDISEATRQDLAALGITQAEGMVPTELFSWAALTTPVGFLTMVVGGFLVGFGARYAGGCTSGHAIAGLSNLQWPSLVAVVGFFAGGLLITHLVLPLILN